MPGRSIAKLSRHLATEVVVSDERLETVMDALARQLLTSMTLANRYDAALALLPDRAGLLMPIRDAHLRHGQEIVAFVCSGVAGGRPVVPPKMSDVDAETVLDGLREAEDAAQRQASEACLAAPVEQATLFGTIAAALASHQEALC